ncbi:hypothetical protein [Zavarzinella formosa]|uniref:hypothetical protein n=1 Tax=Zavarzinella formosa TaxID=360055 RepID=UPI00031719B8|nr:hypothetical protein [Zavarzinella formosa]
MNRTYRVRLAIIGITALLTLLLTIQPGHSQFPNRPGGGIAGNPSGIAGRPTGIAGNPGGLPGIPNGIAGRPAMPTMPTMPGMPGGPAGIAGRTGITGIGGIPTPPIPPPGFGGIPGPPPGFGGIPGPPPGFGGIPGPNLQQWVCTRCNRVLGTGPVPPAIGKCPGCGALLVGTDYGPGGGPGGGIAGMPNNPGMPLNNPGMPLNNPGAGMDTPQPFIPPASPPQNFDNARVSVPSSASSDAPEQHSSKRYVIVFITIGVLVLIGAAIMIIYASLPKEDSRSRPRKAPKAKPKPSWRDDDDDDDDRPRRRRSRRDDDD